MKFETQVTREWDVDAIRVDVPIRDADDLEALPRCLVDVDDPTSYRLKFTLDLNTRKVRDWPEGQSARIDFKVRDEGSYYLLSGDEVVSERIEGYVPRVMPGQHFGDYIQVHIGPDGTVMGWEPTEAKLRSFGS